ncbi:hypothetical protein [Enterobacter hormaechei]|uniref:hypothetical protein n=1 Tax=Enterobacter hormaechei TaxID=158836 RepID=UPI003D7CA896
MSSTGPTLNLTYDELLDEIKSILRVLSRHSSSSREHEKPRGSHRMMPSTGVKITTIIS